MDTSSPVKRRLNPFVLPAETDTRFLLLIVSVLMLSSFVGDTVIKLVAPGLSPAIVVEKRPDVSDPDFIEKATQSAQNMLKTSIKLLAVPAILVLGTFLLGGLLYWMHPVRIRRKKQAVPMKAGIDPALEKELSLLGQQAEIFPPPQIELSKGFTTDGQAYGLPGHYVLRLGGGMRLLVRKAKDLFQAIVLHEMAHIYNRDVWRTYLAQSIWTATIWIALIPLFLTLSYILIWRQIGQPLLGLADFHPASFWEKSLSYLLIIIQSTACLLLVGAIRAGLLRAREVYADWRAVSWGAETGLQKILERVTQTVYPAWKVPWLRLHPSIEERRTLLADPGGLFQIRNDLPFLAGVLIAWIIRESTTILPTVLVGTQAIGILIIINDISLGFLGLVKIIQVGIVGLVFLVLAYLLVGSLGQQIQRKVLIEMIDGHAGVRGYLNMLGPAFLVAAGTEIGFWVIPFGDVSTVAWPTAKSLLQFLFLATLLNWLGLVYSRFTGLKILGQHTGNNPPKWKARLLNLALTSILSIFYFYLAYWRTCYIVINDAANTALCNFTNEGLFVIIAVYIAVFFGTYLLIILKQLLIPARCPHCGNRIKSGMLIGKNHSDCEKPLTEWLFVPSSFPIRGNMTKD